MYLIGSDHNKLYQVKDGKEYRKNRTSRVEKFFRRIYTPAGSLILPLRFRVKTIQTSGRKR